MNVRGRWLFIHCIYYHRQIGLDSGQIEYSVIKPTHQNTVITYVYTIFRIDCYEVTRTLCRPRLLSNLQGILRCYNGDCATKTYLG